MKRGILSGWDEFNYLNYVNYLDFKSQYPDDEFYVDATDTTDILFPNFDKIVIPNKQYFNTNLITHNESAVSTNRFSVNDIKEGIKKWYEENGIQMFGEEILNQEYLGCDPIYSFMFRTTAKRMQDRTLKWILPKKQDYTRTKELLSHIKKPIVVIVGRNLTKSPTRNDILKPYVKELIRLGAFVVNTTIHPPKLQFNNYMEVGSDTFTYSEQVAYFLNANVVISLGNGAGISVHLTTPSNIVTFSINKECTIRSDQAIYQHNGLDLISSRQGIESMKTIFTQYGRLVDLPQYLKFDKPEVKEFFDESKIIKIDL